MIFLDLFYASAFVVMLFLLDFLPLVLPTVFIAAIIEQLM